MAQSNPTCLVYTERNLLKEIERLETKQDRDAKTKEQVDLLRKLHHIGKSVCQIRIKESAQAPSFHSETGHRSPQKLKTDRCFNGNGFYYGEGWIATNSHVAQGGLDKAKVVFSWYENQSGETEPVKSEVSFECSPAFSIIQENSDGVVSRDLAFCELTELETSKESISDLQPAKIELAQDPSPETEVYHIYWRFEGEKADKLFTITKLTDECEDIIQFESKASQKKGCSTSGSPVLVQQPSTAAKDSLKELSLLGVFSFRVFSTPEVYRKLGCAISYYNTNDYAEQITLIMSNIQRLKKLYSEWLLIEQESSKEPEMRAPLLKRLNDEIDSLIERKSHSKNTVVFFRHVLPDIKFPLCTLHSDVKETAAILIDYVKASEKQHQTQVPGGFREYCNFDRHLPEGFTYYEAQVGTGREQLKKTASVALLYNSKRRKFTRGGYNFKEIDTSQWRKEHENNVQIWRRVRNTVVELKHFVRNSALDPQRDRMPPVGYKSLGRNPGHGLQKGRKLEKYHKADVNRGCWRVVIGFDDQNRAVYQFSTYDHYKTFCSFAPYRH